MGRRGLSHKLDYIRTFDTKTPEGRMALMEQVADDTIADARALAEILTKHGANLARLRLLEQLWSQYTINCTPMDAPFIRKEYKHL